MALVEHIDLSQNTSLRDITFQEILISLDQFRLRPYSCDWIVSIVSSIAHPSLETVTIPICYQYIEDIDKLELSTLDTLFSNQPLSKTSTKLRVCTTDGVDREEFRTMVKDRLPRLDGRKQLELVFASEWYLCSLTSDTKV